MSDTIFVGGPIQYALSSSENFDLDLKDLLEKTLNTLDRNGYETLSAHRYEKYGEMDVTDMHKEVCLRDFKWMKSCDVFVAILPAALDGKPVRIDGTCVELGWASALGKKIIILSSDNTEYSHLVKGLFAVGNVRYLNVNNFISNPSILIEVLNEMK